MKLSFEKISSEDCVKLIELYRKVESLHGAKFAEPQIEVDMVLEFDSEQDFRIFKGYIQRLKQEKKRNQDKVQA